VTPERADEIARELYAGHPAAATLVMEAVHGVTEERRRRSARALACLDPMEPVPNRMDDLGRKLGIVLVDGIGRSTDKRQRARLSRLLQSLCRESMEIEAGKRDYA
jgi:hypothetical protein